MNQRLKRVKTLLKRAEQKGLNIDKITEGKSLETLSRNAKSLANFEKRYERQKQLPKLKEEVKQIDVRFLKPVKLPSQHNQVETSTEQSEKYVRVVGSAGQVCLMGQFK